MNSPDSSTRPSRLERLAGFLRVDSDNTSLRRDFAALAMSEGRIDLARPELERLCNQDDATPDDFAALVSAKRRLGDTEGAAMLASKALGRWPDHDWVRLESALLGFAARRFEHALASLPQVTSDAALYPRIAETRIALLHHLGRLDEAVQFAEAVLQDIPKAYGVMACITPVLYDLNQFDRAVSFARKVEAGPEPRYEVLETLAAAALDADKGDEASRYVERALAVRQDDGRIWLLAGLREMQRKHFDEAEAAFVRAVGLLPQHAGSHIAHGWNLVALGRLDEAERAFEAAIEASPAFADAHGSLAALHALQGRRDIAEEQLRKVSRLDAHAASLQYTKLLLGQAGSEQISQLARVLIERGRRAANSR
jgi:tetratricopeptide (TPR) repeat protein